jgi:hypothetical protein
MEKTGRIVNVFVAVWLVVSTWLWPQTSLEQTNAWTVGTLMILFAVAAAARGVLRYLNTALAAWLFASIWVLPAMSTSTALNWAIVALLALVFSLFPNVPLAERGPSVRRVMPRNRPKVADRPSMPPSAAREAR